jgi:hypothetical protein
MMYCVAPPDLTTNEVQVSVLVDPIYEFYSYCISSQVCISPVNLFDLMDAIASGWRKRASKQAR